MRRAVGPVPADGITMRPVEKTMNMPDADPVRTLAALRAEYPRFAFGRECLGRHGAPWVARRLRPADPGVQVVITADLAELRAALDADEPLSDEDVPQTSDGAGDRPGPAP